MLAAATWSQPAQESTGGPRGDCPGQFERNQRSTLCSLTRWMTGPIGQRVSSESSEIA
ncbi:MAG: hypothetical protein R3F08_15035 [Dokdonella sp.]